MTTPNATKNPIKPTSDKLLALVLSSLDDDKALEVVQIDLRGKTEIGDHMVVASGRSTRQVSAMAEKLVDRVKQTFDFTPKVEGKDTGDWVLIDTGDIIVHLFRPEVRDFYQLEKMWQSIGHMRPQSSDLTASRPFGPSSENPAGLTGEPPESPPVSPSADRSEGPSGD